MWSRVSAWVPLVGLDVAGRRCGRWRLEFWCRCRMRWEVWSKGVGMVSQVVSDCGCGWKVLRKVSLGASPRASLKVLYRVLARVKINLFTVGVTDFFHDVSRKSILGWVIINIHQ